MAWAVAHLAGLIDDVHRVVKEVIKHAGRHGYAAGDGGQQGHLEAQKRMQVPSAPNLYAHLALAVFETGNRRANAICQKAWRAADEPQDARLRE